MGNLLLRSRSLPENSTGRCGKTRGKGIQNGGPRGLPEGHLRGYDARLGFGPGNSAEFQGRQTQFAANSAGRQR